MALLTAEINHMATASPNTKHFLGALRIFTSLPYLSALDPLLEAGAPSYRKGEFLKVTQQSRNVLMNWDLELSVLPARGLQGSSC